MSNTVIGVHLRDSLTRLFLTYKIQRRVWVAYSGGADSHGLLHLIAGLWEDFKPLELHALHVDHGLHPASNHWAIHCKHICAELQIPCQIVPVLVSRDDGSSLEAAARTARYAAFRQVVEQGEALLLAHHAEDQAETLLLQLLRGAGTAGLAAMPEAARLGDAWLLRPLLNIRRVDLSTYAKAQCLTYVDDPSNADLRFERNFLRHRVMPILQARWPGVVTTLTRAARHQAEALALQREVGRQDVGEGDDMLAQGCDSALLRWHTRCPPLLLADLQNLSPVRRINAVRIWLSDCGLALPSSTLLGELLRQTVTAGHDRQPLTRWSGTEIRRYQGKLYVMPTLPSPSQARLSWDLKTALPLPWGHLHAQQTVNGSVYFPPQAKITVQFRRGGETCHWRGHLRRLKQLVQEAGVLPWLRDFIPLVYIDGELAVIPGVGIGDGFKNQTTQMGWILVWEVYADSP